MARIWYDADGHILRLAQNATEERVFGAPSGAAGSIEFDETTNAPALQGLNSDWNAHTCPGGVLRRNGVVVVLSADGARTVIRKELLENAQQAVQDNQAYLAVASPTNAQNLAQVRALTRQMNAVIRWLAQDA